MFLILLVFLFQTSITSEPNAVVWIDEIRRGTTDAAGKLTLTKVSAGRHSVRVRANGFKETTAALLPARRALGDIHGHVGPPQQNVRIRGMFGTQGDADAAADFNRDIGDRE